MLFIKPPTALLKSVDFQDYRIDVYLCEKTKRGEKPVVSPHSTLKRGESFTTRRDSNTLQRRDKRRRSDAHQISHISQVNSRRESYDSMMSPHCTLRRANTICAPDYSTHIRNRTPVSHNPPSNRHSMLSQGSDLHSKSTFDSGFETGLSDILDEILGPVYNNTPGQLSPKSNKWKSFKSKMNDTFVKQRDVPDNMSDTSEIKATRWGKVQRFVKVKLARVRQQDVDMGGFEEDHWRSLEPREFQRGTRKTKSMVKWRNSGEKTKCLFSSNV